VSLLATERLPSPLAADGVVFNDPATRTLTVRLSDAASGYTPLLWRQGLQRLAAAAETGWRRGAPTVWANGAGQMIFTVPSHAAQTLQTHS
jgi:hypothetical protein